MTAELSPAARAELAPSGTLRVGINHGNFLLVKPDSPHGPPPGIAPDLALELGRRLDVPVVFVSFDGAGAMAEAVRAGAWDVAFLGAEPARANEIAFTAAYVELEATYLVPAGSPIRSIGEVDRPGVRIATSEKSAYDLFLTRTLKHAQLVRAPGIDASFDLFVAQKLDVLSGAVLLCRLHARHRAVRTGAEFPCAAARPHRHRPVRRRDRLRRARHRHRPVPAASAAAG